MKTIKVSNSEYIEILKRRDEEEESKKISYKKPVKVARVSRDLFFGEKICYNLDYDSDGIVTNEDKLRLIKAIKQVKPFLRRDQKVYGFITSFVCNEPCIEWSKFKSAMNKRSENLYCDSLIGDFLKNIKDYE